MSRKNSKLNLKIDKPSLVLYYQQYSRKIYGFVPKVSEDKYPKFSVFEDDLRQLLIPLKDYAEISLLALKGWTKHAKVGFVPAHIFCSDYALKVFNKVYESESVELSCDDGESIFHSELLAARAYIVMASQSDRIIRLRDVVDDIRPTLSEDWLQLYENGGKRPELKVLHILMGEFNVRNAKNYADIADAIR